MQLARRTYRRGRALRKRPDREGLGAIYEEIDALETTEIEVQNFTSYGELFHYPLAAGLLLLLLEVGLGQTVLRKLP